MRQRDITDDAAAIADNREGAAHQPDDADAEDVDRSPGAIDLTDIRDPEADALADAGDRALDKRQHLRTPDDLRPGNDVPRDDPAYRKGGARANGVDPYARDSDHEYSALEADRGDDAKIDAQAVEFASADANLMNGDASDAGSMVPSLEETRERLDDLDDALDESVDTDPEVLAARDARRNATMPDEVRTLLDEMMDKTPLTADELDTEALEDSMEENPTA